MPIHDFKQSFNAGELSPFMDSRVAVEKYASGCAVLENFIPHVHGPISKRAGFVYLGAAENPTTAVRAVGWNFTAGEYAVGEFSNSEIRFWTGPATVVAAVAAPYTSAQIEGVKFAHVNNIIWLTHSDIPVNRITRTSQASWAIAEILWDYPPMLDENVSTTTMALSASSVGTGRTLTASASYFTSANVGSYVEIAHARDTTFADLYMGDTAGFAGVTLTLQAQPLEGETFTLGTRIYTLRSAGRDAVDEIDIGDDTDELADNIIAAINTGGGGSEPHVEVEAENLGGLKATSYFGNDTGANLADGNSVTVGGVRYIYEDSGNLNNEGEITLTAVGVGSLKANLTRLMNAINRTGIAGDATDPGIDYNTDLVRHPTVEGVSVGPGAAAIAAGAFVTGAEYTITTAGTTDFTLIGSANSTVGTIFTATGPGVGTGTATTTYSRLLVTARTQGAGDAITTETTATNAAWSSATLTGGTRVIRIKARAAGASGNAIVSTETVASATAFAFSGTTLSGGSDEAGTTSTAIIVVGQVEVRSTGRWTGTVLLEKERLPLGSAVWDTVRFWKSANDYNFTETVEIAERSNMRLSFTGSGEAVDGVFARAVLTPLDAYVRGLVKVTGFTSVTAVTVEVLVAAQSTDATLIWSEGAWSPRRGFPRACTFFQNRLWFAGTLHEPAKFRGSRRGDFENFRYDSTDDGAVAFELLATQAQEIQWLAVTHTLIIGTTFGIWVADTTDGQTSITNTQVPLMRQKSAAGCADYQPVMLEDALIYVVRDRRQLRRVTYGAGGEFSTALLTVLAEHITGYTGVGNLAAQQTPDAIIWGAAAGDVTQFHYLSPGGDTYVSPGGDTYVSPYPATANMFTGMSFDSEQNVFAWHRHPMVGQGPESITTVKGPLGTEVWAVVVRDGVRSIERIDPATHNRTLNPAVYPYQMCHVDGAVYDVTAGTGVSGLTHLNGLSVLAWAQISGTVVRTLPLMIGATQPVYTPSAGAITLAQSSTTAWVGTPVISTMSSMKPEYSLRDGSSADRAQRIVGANLRVKDATDGVLVFEGDTQALAAVSVVSISDAAYPVTKKRPLRITGRHREDAQISVKHIGAGPFTLTGIVVQVDIGGTATNHPPGRGTT